ncbi:malate dehydrogenase [Candidatus Saccharibacteria bacterium]|nr:malate dehydrogenase [Candidatus Saccharibacteria bacterium]
MRTEVTVAVTGAAGKIGRELAPRVLRDVLSESNFGADYLVNLNLLEVVNPDVMSALEASTMELVDLGSPHLGEINITDDPNVAFENARLIFLVGGSPRQPGQQRADILEANAPIFQAQGRAINEYALQNAKTLIVANPANSAALITLKNAPDKDPSQFAAMSRLDHNRAMAHLSRQLGVDIARLSRMAIFGNHSNTMVPDISRVQLDETRLFDELKLPHWYPQYAEDVATRGTKVMNALGGSSVISAANAAIECMADWVNGSDDWHSMGVYDHEFGVVSSVPVRTVLHQDIITNPNGKPRNEEIKRRRQASIEDLIAEKAELESLGLI